MKNKEIKVIFDTNVWISFLIGRRLSIIKKYISAGIIQIVTTEQLLTEIKMVTNREKLKKYFPEDSVKELVELLETIAIKVEIKPTDKMQKPQWHIKWSFDVLCPASSFFRLTR